MKRFCSCRHITVKMPTGLQSLAVAAAAASALALVAWRLRRSDARDWAIGWLLVTVMISLFYVGRGSGVTEIVAMTAGFLAFGHFAFGVWSLVRLSPLRIADRCWALLLLAVTGMLVPFVEESSPFHLATICAAEAAFALIAAALIVGRRGRKGSIVFPLAASIFLAWGIRRSFVAAAIIVGGTPTSSAWDLALLAASALAMILAITEDEREAALLERSEVVHLAYHDVLTGLPNRSLFLERLLASVAEARRHDHASAVLFVDLDHFKEINDSLGHGGGDAVLRQTARRIRACIREGDTIARFGGDEFLILINRLEQPEDAAVIAAKILEEVRLPCRLGEREISVTASIGVSVFPIDGSDAETLLRNADEAMYRAKDRGKDCYQLYTPEMNRRAVIRREVEGGLRAAIDSGQLRLRYQPIVAADARLYGFEAMLRWEHPEIGTVSPDDFMAIAEQSALMAPMSGWIVGEACAQAARFRESASDDVRVSLNLSERELASPTLVGVLVAALRDASIPASAIELEIREQILLAGGEQALRSMTDLKSIGFSIAVDGFGRGTCSLDCLERLPVDTVKLDADLIRLRGTRGLALARAVIELAHAIGMKVTAERVETKEEFNLLMEAGVDRVQGYLFAPALSESDAFDYVRNFNVYPYPGASGWNLISRLPDQRRPHP